MIHAEPSKTEDVLKKLETEIRSGRLKPGDRLPSMRQLGERYGVSTIVMVKAVRILSEKGLLKTSERSGIFVADHPDCARQQIALFTTVRQGMLDGYYDALFELSAEKNILVLPQYLNSDWKTQKKAVRNLLDHAPTKILIDLEGDKLKWDRVDELFQSEPYLFFNRFEWTEGRPESAVLVDYTAMTVHALNYLRGRGHRKILYLGHWETPRPFKVAELTHAAHSLGLEFPSPEFDYCSWLDFVENPERVKRIFESADPPSAIFSRSDHIIFDFMCKIQTLYPKFKEMERIGWSDSIWSRLPGQEFSSFKVNFRKLWELAFAKNTPGIELVAPELVIREKSGLQN